MRLSLPLSALLCLFLLPILQAGDWPTFRAGNSRAGATEEKLELPLGGERVFVSPAAPRLSFSGPDKRTIEGQKLRHRIDYDDALHVALAGEKMYFGSSVDHQVRCVSLTNGKQVWTFFTGGPVRLAPTVWGGQVFFGSDDGFAYSLDAKSGKLVWKQRGGPRDERILGRGEMISRWPVRTGVAVYRGAAYFAAGLFPHEDIFLYSLDAKTGKINWSRDNVSAERAGRNPLSPQGYLLVNDKFLFIPSGRSLPACFDRKTGKDIFHKTVSWRREGVVGSTRALLADGQIYAGGAHQLLAMEQKTGKTGFAYIEGKQMAVADKFAYTADGKSISRLQRHKYALASRVRLKLKNAISNIIRQLRRSKNSKKLKKDMAKLVKDLTAVKDKGVLWSTKLKSTAALIVTGSHVVAGGENRVDALDLQSGKIVWTGKVNGVARGLAVADGRLVVSTNTGKIYVFGNSKQPLVRHKLGKATNEPFAKDNLSDLYEAAAKAILKQTNSKNGFCLVVGAERARLAFELAKRTNLQIYGIEPEKSKVAAARQALAKAGLYGHRIVIHQADAGDIPYSSYFANLVVSDSLLLTGKIPGESKKILRHVKPFGGVVCLGQPATTKRNRISIKKLKSWVADLALAEIGKTNFAGNWAIYTRGQLRGAANWTHQYGDPGNTAASEDTRVKGGLGVLWYGDPGPGKMVNRHEGAVGPLAVNGRLIVQGQFGVMAYDAYNGLFLWEYKNPKTFRTGVFQNYNASNLIASDDSVFVMEGEKVVQIDAATGKLVRNILLPPGKRKEYQWNYMSYQDGKLFGTATVRKSLERYLRRRGRRFEDMTDSIFAFDVKTGKYPWIYEGKNIAAPTVAVGPKRVYFVDSSISSEQRAALLRKESAKAKKLKGAAAKLAEKRLKKMDVRMAVALDAATGRRIWARPVDVTDVSEIGAGGGKLTLLYKDNVLLLCGANANGHYWRQFKAGEFKRRRLVALDAKKGKVLWAKDANYRHRPIIIGAKIIAEPWAFNLSDGKQIMRRHPLTGQEVPWSIYRPGHHCGMLTASPNMLMFRSGFTGFYDLYNDSGTQHFAGHRLGCWINAIPANGLVMIPEASAGCVCQFSIASTITMAPRKARRPWTIYSSVGALTPVEHMAINLGAPGDRKDGRSTVWLAYPRPNPYRDAGLDLKLNLNQKFAKGGGFKNVNSQLNKVVCPDAPSWIFSSWAARLNKITVPLRGAKDRAAKYTVRLFFAHFEKDVARGQRVFDVVLNGKIVQEKLDIAAAAKKKNHAVIREFENVSVTRNLVIELRPRTELPTMRRLPILNAVEVIREKQK